MQDDQKDPYEFIMHPEKPKRQFNFGNSTGQRAMIVAGGAFILIVIAIVLASLFNQGTGEQRRRLVQLAQTQNEIIRISELADKESTDIPTRSRAITVKSTLSTDQQEVLALLSARGTELKGKDLSGLENPATDKQLEQASANDRFDNEFSQILNRQLKDYQKMLKKAHDAGTVAEKQRLATDYLEVSILLGESVNL